MIILTAGVMTTTAQKLSGRPIREYLGILSGDAMVTIQRPGRRGAGTQLSLQHARRRALQMLANRANANGATVVVGIAIDYVPIGAERLLVTATGTAVRL